MSVAGLQAAGAVGREPRARSLISAPPVTFDERQSENRRRTAFFLFLFLLLFVALGFGLDVATRGFLQPDGAQYPLITASAFAGSLSLSLLSYYWGPSLVLASLQAQPLTPSNPEYAQLDNIVTEMALASGMPRPALYVIPDPSPNALATGRDPQHAALCVTRGALLLLDREETQGVVAHEMAHIANRDTLTMTVVGVLLGAVAMMADWSRRTLYYSRSRRGRSSGVLLPLVFLLAALAPLLSRLLAMAVSRQREYLADATAVQFTRNPMGLVHALEKISGSVSPLRHASRGTAHLFISDPLHRKLGEREGRLADLLSTHPPIARRIAILRAMAHGGLYE